MAFESRNRGGGLAQRFTRVRPIEFEGSTKLEHREGGAHPLHVKEGVPGVYVSSWMVNSTECCKFIKEMRNAGREFVLSLVVDTNVPGHPSLSMQLQEIFLTED